MQNLTFAGMTKSFGGVPALSDVTLSLDAGRVHALMGENGAGKSTLIRLIAGVLGADRMAARRDGAPLALRSAADADRAGFRFIHQELNIVPQLSVAENVLLGRPSPRRFGALIDWRRLRAAARAALAELGASHIDVRMQAGALAVGDRMLTRLASALVTDAGGPPPVLYVFDEPTAALTPPEAERLFAAIARLKAQGAAILYVSHRIAEVMRIADEVTVLRDGRRVMTAPVAATGRAALITAMTGRDIADAVPARTTPLGRPGLLEARDVQGAGVFGIDFSLAEGEILGLAGLEGAGQSALLRLILGAGRLKAGRLGFAGAPGPRTPAEAWARGIAYVPRERRAEGLMLGMGVRPNMLVAHLSDYGVRAQMAAETRRAEGLADMVGLRFRGPEQPARELSGGNQQKVVFARALAGKPRLLLLEEPSRGVDVGARAEIHALIRRASAGGTGVIVASTDLPELLGLADRLLILSGGRQAGLVGNDPKLTPAALLDLINLAAQDRERLS